MGLYASGDIFQAKVDDLLGDIEGVNMYTDNILVLGKGILFQHIYQRRVVFARLHVTELKFNFPK